MEKAVRVSREAAAHPARGLLRSLAAKIDAALEQAIPAGTDVALVGFPNHSNAGDSAIWLGEERWLERHGHRVAYVCDTRSYSRDELARRIGDGIILITGGGDLGDLWRPQQRLRERVIEDFPHRGVVQLPQTISFSRPERLDRARSAFDAHPDLTLMVRDRRSLEYARSQFAAPTLLCPDMAIALGELGRPSVPRTPILWLARSDAEAAAGTPARPAPDVEVTDWLTEHRGDPGWTRAGHARRSGRRLAGRVAGRLPGAARPGLPLLWRTYTFAARARLAFGSQVLSRGRVVVTDRLHGHVMSLLLGLPHVVLDNSYGKLRDFHAAWTDGTKLVEWAESPDEALERARALAGAAPQP